MARLAGAVWVALVAASACSSPPPDPAKATTKPTYDKTTGKLPYPDDADTMSEIFLAGTEPIETAEAPVPDAGAPLQGDAGVPHDEAEELN